MIKVGIITISKVDNYGAELQSFAFQYKLNKMGYDAENIDYLFYKNKRHKREAISRPFYSFPLKNRLKEVCLPKIEAFKSFFYRRAALRRKKGFEAFHQKYNKYSSKVYTSYSELYENVPEYDVYCVGSDQVWSPSCYTSLHPYFLTFAPRYKKKISYASSFGVSSLPSKAIDYYRQDLLNLDSIAVRESTGVDLVKQLTGRKAELVIDPTLLLTGDEWSVVASDAKVPQFKYLLLYVLKKSNYITRVAHRIAKENGLQIVRICKGPFRQDSKDSGILNIIDAAPNEFVGLFKNADYVLTNSFHGTAFSLIFQRQFYTILKNGKKNNSRQLDLLENIGLKDRIIYENEFKNQTTIDFSEYRMRIEDLRKKSEIYLVNAIG